MAFFSYPYRPIRARATERQVEAVYQAAKMGLVGDNLAHAACLEPADYRHLLDADPDIAKAEAKGRADGEMEMSTRLHEVANDPTHKQQAKAALAILQHKHGWVAKQQVEISVDERISVSVAIDRAKRRVIEGDYRVVEDGEDEDGDDRALMTPPEPDRRRLEASPPVLSPMAAARRRMRRIVDVEED